MAAYKKLNSGYLPFVQKEAVTSPYTDIQNRAKLDASLKCIMGNERINVNSLNLLPKEFGPNGEKVYEPDSGDKRVRIVGDHQAAFSTSGMYFNLLNNGYVEVTFYGTGLNMLHRTHASTIVIDAIVDGVSIGTIFNSTGASSILNARNYSPNQVTQITSGLTLGWHTVKIVRNNDTPSIKGFDIVNEASQITVKSGKAHGNGYEYLLDADQLIDYNLGFDNIADIDLGTRGGRSIVYLDPSDGSLKKRTTQVDAAESTKNEYITNGTFDVDVSDWTKVEGSGSGTMQHTAVDGGRLEVIMPPATRVGAKTTLSGLTVGQGYELTFDAYLTSGAGTMWHCIAENITDVANNNVNTGVINEGSIGVASKGMRIYFTATQTTLELAFSTNSSSTTANWDNVSVKESSVLTLASTDHSNEVPYRIINFQEFGRIRGDDFSTLTGSGTDRVFTLDDGTTTLLGNDVRGISYGGHEYGLSSDSSDDWWVLTFVGTGLDLDLAKDVTTREVEFFVDGTPVGIVDPSPDGTRRIFKVCSGLPYGTHTVKFRGQTSALSIPLVYRFIAYQPKKPTLPEGAIELVDYNIMADYRLGTSGLETIANGTLRKYPTREMTYSDGTWGGDFLGGSAVLNYIGGVQIFDAASSDGEMTYTFFGTGFELRHKAWSSYNANIKMKINGVDLTAANFPGVTFQEYGYDNGYDDANGTLDMRSSSNTNGAGFSVTGLPLGEYTFSMDKNGSSATFSIEAFDIVTPIHTPHVTFGSRSLKDCRNFDSLKDINKTPKNHITSGSFNLATAETLKSKGITQVYPQSLGNYYVYFEEPFVDENWDLTTAMQGRASSPSTNWLLGNTDSITKRRDYMYFGILATANGNIVGVTGADTRYININGKGKLEKDVLEEE